MPMGVPPSDSTDVTAATLLQRAVRGEGAAWERLAALYSPLIYAKCRAMGLGADDASDVTQEVLKSVFLALPNFRRERPGDSFRAWLRTIARNATLDYLGRRSREAPAAGGSVALQRLNDLPDPFGDDQSFSVADRDVALVVRTALEHFRRDYEERTWQAFWRTAVDDEPAVDVARDLGLTPGAVRQAKYKILRRMRQEFESLELALPQRRS